METKNLLNKKITQWLLLVAMLVGCSANALAGPTWACAEANTWDGSSNKHYYWESSCLRGGSKLNGTDLGTLGETFGIDMECYNNDKGNTYNNGQFGYQIGSTGSWTTKSLTRDGDWGGNAKYKYYLNIIGLKQSPGNYQINCYFRVPHTDDNWYIKNGNDNFYFKYTIPGFTNVSPSTLNFADTKVGSETASQSVTFKMYGSTIKLTTSTPTNFTVSTSKPSSSGKSGSVTVTFKPKSTGDQSETLTLTDNYGKTTSITLKGKGTPACTPPTITGHTDGSRCGTGTVTIRATASAGTVKWYAASTGGSSLVEGNSFTTPQIASTTTYYAEADDNGCVSASRTPVTATVITRPAAPTSGGDISVCYGSDAEFKATQANNRCIDWYTTSTGDTKLETCQNTYTKTNLISDYTVYAEARIADNGCISASRTAIKATVNALPTASISGGNEVCQNGSLTLTGSGGTQYSWNNGAYSSTATYNVPTSTSGQKEITLKVKDSNNCESASADQKNVTVKTQPTAGTITSGDPVCKGSTVTLTVDNPSSASVQWQNSSKEDIFYATNTSYTTPKLQTSTDYYVKFTLNGCSSTSAKGTATVKAASLSLTATPAVVNPYTPVTLIAKNQSGTPTNSTWTITGAGSYFTESENPTGVSTVVMKPAKGVETTVTATANVEDCPVSDIYNVTPTPDTEVCN